MVNLSSNNSNNINLSGQTQRNVNVSTPNTNNVNANTMGNSQRARSWAIGEGLIDGEDYSAKYYAQQAKEIEEDIAADTNNAYIWAEGTDEEVQALGGEHSSKGWVNYVLTNPPTATVEQISAGAVITIHDIDGTTTATIYNGQDGTDGIDGTDGQDGFSPVANVTQTSSGATITITDSIGTTTANIINGVNGTNGTNGTDGFSPTATVTKSGTISTITITDKNGTTTANVYDGTGGAVDSVNGQTGDVVLTASDVGALPDTTVIPTKTSDLTNDSGFINGITSSDVIAALGYTPYNSSNPDSYTTSSDFKTINNTSIVGSGNIDTSEIFIAEYGVTTYSDIRAAYLSGKLVTMQHSRQYVLQGEITGLHELVFFSCGVIDGYKRIYIITVDNSDTWSMHNYDVLDDDLSNLSATGQKVIDGQWVEAFATLANGTTVPTSTNMDYDISNYLPNDGYIYEVLFTASYQTTTTNGSHGQIRLTSDIISNSVFVCACKTRASADNYAAGCVILPIGTGRKVSVMALSGTTGIYILRMFAYRRIGTNQ